MTDTKTSDITIRTSKPRTLGGNLGDVQVGFLVEALDPDGNVLYSDLMQFSAKGVGNDAGTAATVSQDAAADWAKANAAQIEAGRQRIDEKAAERAAVQHILDAIEATPDQVVTAGELDAAKVAVAADAVTAKG